MNVGNARCVDTRGVCRPTDESPGRGDIEHWYSNVESHFVIGDAMGKAMKQALTAGKKRRSFRAAKSDDIARTGRLSGTSRVKPPVLNTRQMEDRYEETTVSQGHRRMRSHASGVSAGKGGGVQ